jgi:hypothetical protein
MNKPPDPPGYGHSFGSGHPHSQTGRGRLVPSHDDGRHQLDQQRLRELYPVIPAIIYNEQTSRSSRLRSPSFSDRTSPLPWRLATPPTGLRSLFQPYTEIQQQ